jgi:hypothetical protein
MRCARYIFLSSRREISYSVKFKIIHDQSLLENKIVIVQPHDCADTEQDGHTHKVLTRDFLTDNKAYLLIVCRMHGGWGWSHITRWVRVRLLIVLISAVHAVRMRILVLWWMLYRNVAVSRVVCWCLPVLLRFPAILATWWRLRMNPIRSIWRRRRRRRMLMPWHADWPLLFEAETMTSVTVLWKMQIKWE